MIKTAAAAAVAMASWATVWAIVKRLEANPDPYPREVLSRELHGDEDFIHRLDGTVLRAVCAGTGPPWSSRMDSGLPRKSGTFSGTSASKMAIV
jgi:hypothetical protein